MPSLPRISAKWSRIAANLIALNSKRWTRDKIVAGILCSSVVAKMKTTFSVGSSKVFRSALNAPVESM